MLMALLAASLVAFILYDVLVQCSTKRHRVLPGYIGPSIMSRTAPPTLEVTCLLSHVRRKKANNP